MLTAIQSGWVAQQIDSAFTPRAKNLARRKEGITGVSEFPNVGEAPVVKPPLDRTALRNQAVQRLTARARGKPERAPDTSVATLVEAAEQGASIGQMARTLDFHNDPTVIPPLTPHPFAEPFEVLREASDGRLHSVGKRPCVFLANMGSISHHSARATYAKNFFEAGGFEVIGNNGFRDAPAAVEAFVNSGANIAVICSSDKLYPDVVPGLAAKLKAAGARSVVLAGNPGANEAAYRAGGVDRFIFIKCDVLQALREMLREEGVVTT
jgi:methylmalonyl-CoA mutase